MLEKGWVNKQEEQDDFQREQAVEAPREGSCWPGSVGPVRRDPGDRSTALSSHRTASQERPHDSFITPNSQCHSALPTIRETPQQHWGDRRGWEGTGSNHRPALTCPRVLRGTSPATTCSASLHHLLGSWIFCSVNTHPLLKRLSADWKSSWQILC